MAQKINVVAVVGPTASGKTGLGIQLAKHYNGEIVSADSMQIYKGMNIATAKPTVKEMQGIPHHLIGFLNPNQTYSVALYVEQAKKAIEDIYSRNKLPIIVGGTGLYVKSLLENITFSKNSEDIHIREKLFKQAEENGIDSLLNQLKKVDNEAYNNLLQEKNTKRIVRALEVYYTTGIAFSEHLKQSKAIPSPYNDVRIGLKCMDRNNLYDRINKRVDYMVSVGLLEEAKEFLNSSLSTTAKMAIGYKELQPYFNNECSLEQALEKLKMETRRYAKRQLTWFNRDEKVNWINTDQEKNFEKVYEKACYILQNSGILN